LAGSRGPNAGLFSDVQRSENRVARTQRIFHQKDFEIIEGDFHAIALKDIEQEGQKIAKKGAT
jgi:hypothetical protein